MQTTVGMTLQAPIAAIEKPADFCTRARDLLLTIHPTSDNRTQVHTKVGAWFYGLCEYIWQLEQEGRSRGEILNILAPVRQLLATAPLYQRCQNWPRGYEGDFETIEKLFHARNDAAPDTLPFYLEEFTLNIPIVQQHRNKIQTQARYITEALLDQQHDGDLLLLAAGGCLDLRAVGEPVARTSHKKVVINDADPDALVFASERLKSLAASCTYAPGNVIKILRSPVVTARRYCLILSGGLFDYLEDKAIIFVLRIAYERLLAPGGKLVFTNIARGNRYRQWMEYLTTWVLIERDEAQIANLLAEAGIPLDRLKVSRETCGLACIAEVVR